MNRLFRPAQRSLNVPQLYIYNHWSTLKHVWLIILANLRISLTSFLHPFPSILSDITCLSSLDPLDRCHFIFSRQSDTKLTVALYQMLVSGFNATETYIRGLHASPNLANDDPLSGSVTLATVQLIWKARTSGGVAYLTSFLRGLGTNA